jgi:hypothetical protein
MNNETLLHAQIVGALLTIIGKLVDIWQKSKSKSR